MAIINATPDSFYAGSRITGVQAGLELGSRAINVGADMLDIGGESTRPGAERVNAREQIGRVVPLIKALRSAGREIPISVDTTLSEVAAAAINAGADAINDVSGGTESPDMLDLAASTGAGLILMHREVTPERDRYSDQLAAEGYGPAAFERVAGFLQAAIARAIAAGVEPTKLLVDPGLGFGKSVPQNVELIARSGELARLGFPVLAAASRKSFVGRLSMGRDSTPDERLPGTLAISVLQLSFGLRVFRVHDVAAHRQALDMAWAIVADGARRDGTAE